MSEVATISPGAHDATGEGTTHPQRLLARLRQGGGSVVPWGDLVAAMWPDGEAPDSARNMIQTYASLLRDDGHRIATVRGRGMKLAHDEPDPPPPLPRHERKERRCLGGCGVMFLSDGPGNRICDRCGDRAHGEAFAEFSVARP